MTQSALIERLTDLARDAREEFPEVAAILYSVAGAVGIGPEAVEPIFITATNVSEMICDSAKARRGEVPS